MGDRAGTVGYLLPGPLVQTEGLMMDLNFLKLIQNKTPLLEALADYNVRYYISSIVNPPSSGCFHAVEPLQAGPKVSAHGCHLLPTSARNLYPRWCHSNTDLRSSINPASTTPPER